MVTIPAHSNQEVIYRSNEYYHKVIKYNVEMKILLIIKIILKYH